MTNHESDVDYSAQNAPDDAALTEMMESALFLADLVQGRGRRRVDAEGRGLRALAQRGPQRPATSADLEEAATLFASLPVIANPQFLPDSIRIVSGDQGHTIENIDIDPPRYSVSVFQEAVAAAQAQTSPLAPADQMLVASSFEVIGNLVTRMREIALPYGTETQAILGHALNSIDLGLIGLAKAKGGD